MKDQEDYDAVASRSASSATAHRNRAAALEAEHLWNRLQEVGARLRPASTRPASVRLSELRARVNLSSIAAGETAAVPS